MNMVSTWNDMLTATERVGFVGRSLELLTFRQTIAQEPARYLVFAITGNEGVGKTTLLNEYAALARDAGVLVVHWGAARYVPTVGYQQSAPLMMHQLAVQLRDQGLPLKRFEQRYELYQQQRHAIENDPEAPLGLAALIEQTLRRGVVIAADLVPGLHDVIASMPQSSHDTPAAVWVHYLEQKLPDPHSRALIQLPSATLTPLFLADLNDYAQKQRLLLCFDDIETLGDDLPTWFANLPDYQLSTRIQIALAGQTLPDVVVQRLRSVMLLNRIAPFTQGEAEHLLDMYAIPDPRYRKAICETAEYLPVLMTWLALVKDQETERWSRPGDMVDRVLRRLGDPEQQRALLLAALPSSFNAERLAALVSDSETSFDSAALCAWLATLPFVSPHADGWQYHPVIRRMLLRYQHNQDKQAYYERHRRLARYERQGCPNLGSAGADRWADAQWQQSALAFVYHGLIADPRHYWPDVMGLLARALWERQSFASVLIDLLESEGVQSELPRAFQTLIHVVNQQWRSLQEGTASNVFAIFDDLRDVISPPPHIRSYLLSFRAVFAVATATAKRC
ncbi:MAG: ATP-binding protein [Chloroflexaceae bacterium]|nr:ATP-binding protein [Chloroflexaceae bacterium]